MLQILFYLALETFVFHSRFVFLSITIFVVSLMLSTESKLEGVWMLFRLILFSNIVLSLVL